MKAKYGIDGLNAIKGLLLGALALLFVSALINFFLFKLTLSNAIINGFWWTSFCVASIFLMLLSSLYGKFVMRDKLINDLQIKGNEKILDVGCGRGLLLIALAKKLTTGRAVGLDIWSRDDLSNNSAKNTFKNAEIENVISKIELITGDMTAMNFNNNSFDIVVSSVAIHNLQTKILREKAIQEINRVLKPGGQVALLDFQHTKEYQQLLSALGWKTVLLSKRYFWMFPPVRIVTGKKPID